MAPGELAAWLEDRIPRLREAWAEEIAARGSGHGPEMERVIARFLGDLTDMLPLLLGPRRGQVRPLWIRACELFGVLAAKRGLASGEVVEEFHAFRELLIRELYKNPPHGGRRPLSLPETLRLNRALDHAVTHASIGHTDALFFRLLEDGSHPVPASPEAAALEAETQLDAIAAELRESPAVTAGAYGGDRDDH